MPRDRDASFSSRIVAKRKRLSRVDDLVISLTAIGLTTGEFAAHLGEIYGAAVSKETSLTITDRVLDTVGEWQNRQIYPVTFIDAIKCASRKDWARAWAALSAFEMTLDGNSPPTHIDGDREIWPVMPPRR